MTEKMLKYCKTINHGLHFCCGVLWLVEFHHMAWIGHLVVCPSALGYMVVQPSACQKFGLKQRGQQLWLIIKFEFSGVSCMLLQMLTKIMFCSQVLKCSWSIVVLRSSKITDYFALLLNLIRKNSKFVCNCFLKKKTWSHFRTSHHHTFMQIPLSVSNHQV